MNNNINKYLRLSMLISIAAVVVSIGFTACTDDTFVTEKQETAPVKGYQFSIPANMGGDQTRAIAYNSQTGGYDATFETTDYIAVYNVTKQASSNNGLSPDADGKKANLVGNLTFSKFDNNTYQPTEVSPEVGDVLYLGYKGNGVFYSRNFSNEWESDDADFAVATVKITAINDGLITTEPATFVNQQSIYKISFTGLASNVLIKKVIIHSDHNVLVSSYYPNQGEWATGVGDVTYTYAGEGTDKHDLNFMLRFDYTLPQAEEATGNDKITFSLQCSDGHYYVGSKAAPDNGFMNSKYYEATVALEDMGLALALTDDATGNPVEFDVIIDSQKGAYTLSNNGYESEIEWRGGPKTLTFKNLSVQSSYGILRVMTSYTDPDNSKEHFLVLNGENYLYSTKGSTAIDIWENCSLTISAATPTSSLALGGDTRINLSSGAVLTINSGELYVGGYVSYWSDSRIIIGKDGKLRAQYITPSIVKAASGYVLKTAVIDNITEFTVTPADPYQEPKALSEATTADIGKLIGSDGYMHVLHWDLPNGVKPVGVIADISSTGHGLAFATNRVEKKIQEPWGGIYTNRYFSWDNSDSGNNGKTTLEIFNEWATSNSVSFGTWRIPTMGDFQKMIINFRIDGDATDASYENMISNGFKAKLISAGLEIYEYIDFWTSTKEEAQIYMSMRTPEPNTCTCFFYGIGDEAKTSVLLPVLEF